MKNNKSLAKEGKEIEQELKALHKKLRADTRNLKKRYQAYVKRVDRFCEKNWEDTDLCLLASAPLDKCETVLYHIPDVLENWDIM